MAQSGYTPIQLYYSSTTTNAPTAGNLASGELAINITDGKLFYKDNANAVQVIGWKLVPVSAGGTGATTLTGLVVGNGTSAFTAVTAPSGAVVGTTDTQTLTNKTFTGYTETVYALSGTAIDPANGTIQTKTLGANTTFTESLADGQSVVLMINPVTYNVTWPTMTWINVAGSGSAPTLEASSTNVVVMWQVGGTVYGNWAGSA
jgi:hypothetical protein